MLLSVGASQASKALVTAHSGALAAADGAWEALAGAYGMHRVRDLAELADAARLRAAGVPVLEGTRSGLLALRHLLDHAVSGQPPAPAPARDPARQQRWADLLAEGSLSGAVLFDLLRDYGIPAVRARPACTRAGALAAAAQIGYPVVIKTDEPRIAHKSDLGGVRLGLGDPAAAAEAYDDLAARLGPRVLVCETARPAPSSPWAWSATPPSGPPGAECRGSAY